MRFDLKAVGPDGRIESLDFEAFDRDSAVEQAESRGYTVLVVKPRASLAWASFFSGDEFPVLLFAQELLVLLRAGLPLVESIETLAQKERRADWRALLAGIAASLRRGQPFSAALAQFPRAFTPLYVATVRAAEKTSDLPPALERFVAYRTQLEIVRRKVINAAIYPLVLIAVGGLVCMFLLFYVVPRFGRIYAERVSDLPVFSRLLLDFGQLVSGYGGLALAAAAVAAAALLYGARRERIRAAIGDALWRLPALGERLKLYQLARFYRTIGMLLRGGVPLVSALSMGADLLHPVLRARLSAAARAVSEGRAVSDSMEANGLATPVALRMLIVGESSGNMGEMMERIAQFHDEEIGRWVDWFTRLFEPILMALIGLVIGLIVVLMYLPIFELAGNLR